jgi:hypothetical protein
LPKLLNELKLLLTALNCIKHQRCDILVERKYQKMSIVRENKAEQSFNLLSDETELALKNVVT